MDALGTGYLGQDEGPQPPGGVKRSNGLVGDLGAHICLCVLTSRSPWCTWYLPVHVLMWSHPGDLDTHACLYVRVLVVTSERPWCTCMFVCAHMVISGGPWYTHISACVLTWSYLRDCGAHTCLSVFTLMWSHPGDLGAHVCLCVCMLMYSHTGQTCLQL